VRGHLQATIQVAAQAVPLLCCQQAYGATDEQLIAAASALQDIEQTQFVCDYIAGKHTREEFFDTFHPNAMSQGFDPDQDLQSIGIANQTTMLKVTQTLQDPVDNATAVQESCPARGGRL
jgi:hypothetical protein